MAGQWHLMRAYEALSLRLCLLETSHVWDSRKRSMHEFACFEYSVGVLLYSMCSVWSHSCQHMRTVNLYHNFLKALRKCHVHANICFLMVHVWIWPVSPLCPCVTWKCIWSTIMLLYSEEALPEEPVARIQKILPHGNLFTRPLLLELLCSGWTHQLIWQSGLHRNRITTTPLNRYWHIMNSQLCFVF